MSLKDNMAIRLRLVALMLMCIVRESKTTKMCTAFGKLDKAQEGIQLTNRSFLNKTVNSFMFCAKQCFLHKLCESFNWNQVSNSCELNYESFGRFLPENQFIFSNITGWPNIIDDACSNHDCPVNTRCDVTSSGGFTCVVIGCWGIPLVSNVNKTSFDAMFLRNFNDMVLYPCDQGFYPSVNVTCTSVGKWSNFTCLPVSSCTQIMKCNRWAEDDEYWIEPENFSGKVKIYCIFYHTSAKEYITFSEYNTATNPIHSRKADSCHLEDNNTHTENQGYTDFQRVGLSLTAKRVYINQHKFSNSTYNPQNYGNAGDCINHGIECGVIGEFIVDFRGTSFRVNTSTTWEMKGTNARIERIKFSNDSTRVVGLCGGDCGGCRPTQNEFFVEKNPDFDPPDESAAHTFCPYTIDVEYTALI